MNRAHHLGLTRYLLLLLIPLVHSARAAEPTAPSQACNVIFVTIDGMRWQEVFGGANRELLDTPAGGVRDRDGTRAQFWRDTPDQRRAALMPFLWNTIARQGQLFGDPSAHCSAQVTNGLKFSYPGYSEMFCGFADPRIDSNDKVPNPNRNVLEWLSHRDGFEGRVAAYGSWDRLPFILNVDRSHLPVHAGWEPIADTTPLTTEQREVNAWLPELPHIWDDDTFDVVMERSSMEYIRAHHPRVFYIMFGETDEWGHMRRYDCYLEAAHRNDRFLANLWQALQSMPEYAGSTSLVVTTDHGRGATARDWGNHGKDTDGAEHIWIAAMGPGVPALGVRHDVSVTQSQVAATLAALVGEDYHAAEPKSAPALPGVVNENAR
jgi:hypothetical protein